MTFDPFDDLASRGCLRNNAGLHDPTAGKEYEHRAFLAKLDQAYQSLAQIQRLTYRDVLATHKTLFEAVTPFSGSGHGAITYPPSANAVALSLSPESGNYEPLFSQRRVGQKVATIIDEWCSGYVKGISLDAKGWQPLREAHPEWLEPIELYGTVESWERLKTLVDNHPERDARHRQWVERIAPAARQIHEFWLNRRAAAESETLRSQ
jgi:hypothetical protein